MIRFAIKGESEQIVALWQEAFGDSRTWVLMYLSEHIDNVLVYEEDGIVMGMLSLLPVEYREKKGFYVYGVATGEKYRSMGVSSKLLDYAKNLVGDVGFLVLVPRNQGLFSFYENRGFFPMVSVKTRTFSREEIVEKSCGWEVLSASCREYYEIRKSYFENLIEWDESMLMSIKKFENGEYYRTSSGFGAFCYAYNGTLYIKELCGDISFAGAIAKLYDVEKVLVTECSGGVVPSCMTYPQFSEKVFFNISID